MVNYYFEIQQNADFEFVYTYPVLALERQNCNRAIEMHKSVATFHFWN